MTSQAKPKRNRGGRSGNTGGTYCAVIGCNSNSGICQWWKESLCEIHGLCRDECCREKQPYKLHRFPNKMKYKDKFDMWVRKLHRANFTPNPSSRVCSLHFVDHGPTAANPYPELNLGYEPTSKGLKLRKPPRERPFDMGTPSKRRKQLEERQSSPEPEPVEPAETEPEPDPDPEPEVEPSPMFIDASCQTDYVFSLNCMCQVQVEHSYKKTALTQKNVRTQVSFRELDPRVPRMKYKKRKKAKDQDSPSKEAPPSASSPCRPEVDHHQKPLLLHHSMLIDGCKHNLTPDVT